MKKLEKLSDSKFQAMEVTEAKLILGGGNCPTPAQCTGGSSQVTNGVKISWTSDCIDSEGVHHYGVTMS